jgi:hypothetical protein
MDTMFFSESWLNQLWLNRIIRLSLDFEIFKPQGKLAGQIQAIWSVSVASDMVQTVRKELLSDAGTGVTFIL